MPPIEIAVLGITILLGIVGYFLKIIHLDVRANTLECGKNKGRIEQLKLLLDSEIKLREIHLKNQEEATQKAIEQMAKSVNTLSEDVRMLINQNIKR